VPGEFDVVCDRRDQPFDLLDPTAARVTRPTARLDEALSRRREPMAIEEVGALLPGVFGEGDRGPQVRRLPNRVPRLGEELTHPIRLPGVGVARGPDEIPEERV